MTLWSFKTFNSLVDISRAIASLSKASPEVTNSLEFIALCLKITSLLWDCTLELQVVSDKERDGMLNKVKSLHNNVQEIERIQKQQEIESGENEIKALYFDLQKIVDLLKNMDEEAKHPWYKRLISGLLHEKSMTERFNAMKVTIDFIFQKSVFIVIILNLKLTASTKQKVSEGQKEIISKLGSEVGVLRSELGVLRSELGVLRSELGLQYNTLNKEVAKKLHTLFLVNNDGIDDLVTDESVIPPDPPNLHDITQSEGKLIVKWEAQSDEIDLYILCYDVKQNLIKKYLGNVYEAKIGPPEIDLVRGKSYTMKMCAVNSGGRGKWSNPVVRKFTKPVPSKPEPPKVYSISASTVKIILTTPKLACPTESSVTEWEVEYAMLNSEKSGKLLSRIFKVEHPGIKKSFHTMDLDAKQTYSFCTRARNAEGQSSYSETIEFEMIHSCCARYRVLELIILLHVVVVFFSYIHMLY